MPRGAWKIHSKTFFCHYCKKEFRAAERTVDHIVPSARGGVSERFNYVDACSRCNVTKGDDWPTCTCNRCRRSRRLHWRIFGIHKNSRRP